MKIYLAAPYAARDFLKERDLPFWESEGHEVTCGWVKGTRPIGADTLGASVASSEDEVRQHSLMDLADIDRAEALVLYTARYIVEQTGLDPVAHNLNSGGRHVEVGYALGQDKPVVVIGPLENIFQRGLCVWAYSLPSAAEALNRIEATAEPRLY